MSSGQKIRLLQLYPNDMNIYGDWGNTLTLKRRLEWQGYDVELLEHNPGDTFPSDVDLIVGGGGQDSGQARVGKDLIEIGPKLRKLADEGLPMLMVCGLYQQFGKFFRTKDGKTPARPFFYPTWKAKRAEFRRKIRARVRTAIKETWANG